MAMRAGNYAMILLVVALLLGAGRPAKTSLDVFIESGCPECQRLVFGELDRTIEAEGVLDSIDFRLVAFGNSYWPQERCPGQLKYNRRFGSPCWVRKCGVDDAPSECWGSSTSELLCQHGVAECRNDLVINCAIDAYPDPAVYMPFVNCIEQKYPSGAMECARGLGLDYSRIQGCTEDKDHSWEVTKDAGEMTAQARIPGTPTLFLNGQMMSSYLDLLSQVCETFEEDEAPLGCKSVRQPCKFPIVDAWIDAVA